jgi:UDP-glucose 4-epimerase
VAGAGAVRHVPGPPEKKVIDIGSFYADSTRFTRAVGWTPRVSLRAGLTQTIAYYRAHLEHYIDEADRSSAIS